jgi:hypothetical protein
VQSVFSSSWSAINDSQFSTLACCNFLSYILSFSWEVFFCFKKCQVLCCLIYEKSRYTTWALTRYLLHVSPLGHWTLWAACLQLLPRRIDGDEVLRNILFDFYYHAHFIWFFCYSHWCNYFVLRLLPPGAKTLRPNPVLVPIRYCIWCIQMNLKLWFARKLEFRRWWCRLILWVPVETI